MKHGLISLVLLAASASAEVLVTVGTKKITTEDFRRRLEEIRKQAPSSAPSAEQFLEDLIRFKVGVQQAEKMELQNEPVVRERYDQVLYNALLEKELGSKVEKIKIKESEMKDFYKRNPELRIAHILIDIKENATQEERQAARKRALEILDEVKKSKRPFDELVKLYSDDTATKEMGGDIGYQSRVTLAPTVYEAASKMTVGETKGLVDTGFGFHILKLLDRRGYDLADKQQIRAALFDERRARLFNDYFDRLKRQYRIEINKDALKTVKDKG